AGSDPRSFGERRVRSPHALRERSRLADADGASQGDGGRRAVAPIDEELSVRGHATSEISLIPLRNDQDRLDFPATKQRLGLVGRPQRCLPNERPSCKEGVDQTSRGTRVVL